MIQPLFPDTSDDSDKRTQQEHYVLSGRHATTIQPLHGNVQHPHPAPVSQPPAQNYTSQSQDTAAVTLIRSKVEKLYATEPSAKQEMREAAQSHTQQPSKHQRFMYELSTSGKPLAQIQAEWHGYYVNLPDNEKHEVWQEFYANSQHQPSAYLQHMQPSAPTGFGPAPQKPQPVVVASPQLPSMLHQDRRTVPRIRRDIQHTVRERAEAPNKFAEHLKSLAFGLGTGAVVLVILLFGFFNELVIAPFIQPSRHVSATPIILSKDSIAPTADPEVIIPKINVEIPVVYDTNSIDEAAIENSLEDGVVHYATTSLPGQQGNAAFFGHSSNNIFNKGKYKFAFVLLHELVPGDVFYLTYNQKVYTYKVFDRKVVPPTEISVLNPVAGKTATATLITCDPPGTSTNRLVIWGEQINPDPATAEKSTPAVTSNTTPNHLPSESQSLWSRIIHLDF